MKFLEGLRAHPALKHNVFGKEQRRRDIDLDNKILLTIQGSLFLLLHTYTKVVFTFILDAATEGFNYLNVRKNFWESSEVFTSKWINVTIYIEANDWQHRHALVLLSAM